MGSVKNLDYFKFGLFRGPTRVQSKELRNDLTNRDELRLEIDGSRRRGFCILIMAYRYFLI